MLNHSQNNCPAQRLQLTAVEKIAHVSRNLSESLEAPLQIHSSNALESIEKWWGKPLPPVLLLGEGSHRTHEFFAVQAEITKQAIERGCTQVLLEVPSLYVEMLRAIMTQNSPQKDIEDFVRSHFYPTWNDRSIVDLLSYIAERNKDSTRGKQIQVLGMDPQIGNINLAMSELSKDSRLQSGVGLEKLDELKVTVQRCETALGTWYENSVNWNETQKQELSSEFNELGKIAKNCSSLSGLSSEAQRTLNAIAAYCEFRAKQVVKHPLYRDELMATCVIHSLQRASACQSSQESAQGPKVVVLAHNWHVSFDLSKPAAEYRWSGSILLTKIPNQFLTVCQTSGKGKVAVYKQYDTSPSANGAKEFSVPPFTNDSIERSHDIISPSSDSPLVLLPITALAQEFNQGFPKTRIRQWAERDLAAGPLDACLDLSQHIHFLIVHGETGPAKL